MSESIVSIFNSTDTLLESREQFIGSGERCLQYKNIGVNIKASHPSSPNGFQIQFSSDNEHWDTIHYFSVGSGTGCYYNIPVEAEYFRIVYINGATRQDYFRLQTIMHLEVTKETTLRLKDPVSEENAAQLTRSCITGKDPDGVYNSISIEKDGSVKVNITGGSVEMFDNILSELKKLNMYMEILTGEILSEEDVKEGYLQ